MRAKCCVCFNLLDIQHIAACPCGHTFHEECLMRWMDTSSSCPSCRTHVNKDQIIKRLFFDIKENCSVDEHVEQKHKQGSNLKVRHIKKEQQRRKLIKSRDRLSALLSVSEAARHRLLTKFSDEKNINDSMKNHLSLIIMDDVAFIKEMRDYKETLRKLQVSQNFTTEMEDCQNDARDIWNQSFWHCEPLVKQLTSASNVIKREYYEVKTVLQGQVTELKLSNSEVQKYKQEMIALKKDMEKTSESLKEVLSEKTILQKQVSELTHSHNEALKYKQEVEVLRECLQKTWTGLNPVLTQIMCLEMNFSAMNCSAGCIDTETQDIFQRMKDLNNKYIEDWNNLTEVQKGVLQRNVSDFKLSFIESQCEGEKLILEMLSLRTDFTWIHDKLNQMVSS